MGLTSGSRWAAGGAARPAYAKPGPGTKPGYRRSRRVGTRGRARTDSRPALGARSAIRSADQPRFASRATSGFSFGARDPHGGALAGSGAIQGHGHSDYGAAEAADAEAGAAAGARRFGRRPRVA